MAMARLNCLGDDPETKEAYIKHGAYRMGSIDVLVDDAILLDMISLNVGRFRA